jgi:hypothetical protein
MLRRTLLSCSPLVLLPRIGIAHPLSGSLSGGTPVQAIDTLNSINGSVANAYGTWTFGQGITPHTGAGPPGPFGYFCYVKLNGKVVNTIGSQSPSPGGRSGAQQIVVDFGGNVFFLTAENDREWFQFGGYAGGVFNVGSPFIDPGSVFNLALPTPGPYPSPSPDGSTLTSTPGSLVSVDGVWTNGSGGSSWQPTLNGIPNLAAITTGTARNFSQMEVNSNGNMFLFDIGNAAWVAMLSHERYAVVGSVPTGPIPIDVLVTPNPALTGTTPPRPTLPPGASIGTVIASVSVTMSDSSSFSGSLSITAGGASFIGISGANLVTTGATVPGGYFTTVSATAGGITVSPGASTVQIVAS